MRPSLYTLKQKKNRKTGNDDRKTRMTWGMLKNNMATSRRNRGVKVSLAKVEIPSE